MAAHNSSKALCNRAVTGGTSRGCQPSANHPSWKCGSASISARQRSPLGKDRSIPVRRDIITARRIASDDLLKQRNGFCLRRGYGQPPPASSRCARHCPELVLPADWFAWDRLHPQNSPSISPASLTNICSAAGRRGNPGMVMMPPQITTRNSAPAFSRTSLIGIT